MIFGGYNDKWWTEEVAGEHLDACTDEELEDFLRKSRALIIHRFPEPDDHDLPTVAKFVSRDYGLFIGHIPTLHNVMYSNNTDMYALSMFEY